MAKLMDLKGEWASLIGRLFISFGVIEKITHECMQRWMKDPIYDNLKNMKLSPRIDLVIELISTQDFEEQFSSEFKKWLKCAKKLAEQRNLVAHNPLMLVLFEDTGNFKEAITHVHKEEKYIDFDDLKSIVEEVELAENKLMELAVKSKFPGQQVPALTNQASGTQQSGAPS